jgi:hypothetical protein
MIAGQQPAAESKGPILGKWAFDGKDEKGVGYLLGYMVLAYGLMRWFPKLIKHHELMKKDLQRANTETKFLSGLLPICASCKKIRDDAGYWTQIDAYIRDHSEAEFSHGICPECSKNLYPEFAQ